MKKLYERRAKTLLFLLAFIGCGSQGNLDSETRANNAGIALLEQHQFQKAAQTFAAAVKQHPDSVPLLVNLAISKFHLQESEAALELLDRAASLEPDNPYVRFNKGLVFKTQGNQAAALTEFRRVTELDPRDPTSFYNLGVLLLRQKEYDRAIAALKQAMALEKNNIAVYFNLGMAYVRKGQREEGTRYLNLFQKLRKEAPDVEPMSAGQQYTEMGKYSLAIESTPIPRSGRPAKAGRQGQWRRSFLTEVGAERGLTGQLFEVEESARTVPADPKAQKDSARNSTRERLAGRLGSGASSADYDNDGDVDLLLIRSAASDGTARVLLLNNDGKGRFTDVTRESGIPPLSAPVAGVFGDYDNDGWMDLFITGVDLGILLRNHEGRQFEDRTSQSGLALRGFSTAAGWVDYDHDGDLDLFVSRYMEVDPETTSPARNVPGAKTAAPVLYRNNGNGTFSDVSSAAGLADHGIRALGVIFSDLDNDRDVDILVSGHGQPGLLFANERDGTFREVAVAAGATALGSNVGVSAADFDGDGDIDLFFTREKGDLNLHLINQDGKFVPDAASPDLLAAFSSRAGDARRGSLAADLDNDGDLDLLIFADCPPGSGGILGEVFENRGGQFQRWCRLSNPDTSRGVQPRGAVVSDFDGDGRLDLLINDRGGRPLLFKNEHPDSNQWLQLLPAGLRSNKFGYGTKVEIRAGTAYQKLEISSTGGYLSQNSLPLHIGLGSAKSVDRLRLQWPSGVIQSETGIAAGQTLKLPELNRKGTSCPLLYAWNGNRFRFITDFLGGSAVGYQTAPGVYSFPDTDEYILIPGEKLALQDGKYRLSMNNQLEEVLFFDKTELVAVDHPQGTEVYPNERLMPAPPFPPFKIYQIARPQPPDRAWEESGRDVTAAVRKIDREWPAGFTSLPYKGYAEEHRLLLDFGDVSGAETGILLFHAWIDYADSSANIAAAQAGVKLIPPYLEVQKEDGSWVMAFESMGFPAGLPKPMTLDISRLFPRRRLVLRITTSMRIYWDRILLSTSIPRQEPVLTRLKPSKAELNFKGYPASWSPDGRSPKLYDFDKVRKREPWRTHRGNYTRYGDVIELLSEVDDRYVITKHGDVVALEFDARTLPSLPAGWKRDFLFYADGFGKDMDLNSAYPDTVEPLPFHGMKAYPPAGEDSYPDGEFHRQYRLRYNTRRVDAVFQFLTDLRHRSSP